MRKKESNQKTLLWIYQRIKKYLIFVISNSVVAMFSSLIFVALALLTKNILDAATGEKKGSILTYGILLFVVIFVQILLHAVQSYLNTFSSAKMLISIRKYMFASVCKKKYARLSEYHSGDLLNRFTSDIEVVVSSSNSIIPTVVSMITKIIAGIGTMLILDWKIALIILVLGISVPWIGRIFSRRYKALHKECQRTEGKTRSFLQECFENIVVIKTFLSNVPFADRLHQYMKDNYRLKIKRTTISIFSHLALYSFFTVGYYAVLIWGAGQISAGIITYGTLMAFLQLISQLRAPLQNVSGILPQYYSALASAERLIELENCPSESDPVLDDKLNELRRNFRSIEVRNVDFAYLDEQILTDCSFTAKRGDITAITGESGSGKSTVFKLILGLYEPQSGAITVNETEPLDASLRGLFAYVPQGNLVLSGSIMDNITLCDPAISKEKVIEATKAAEIYDYIASLPEGFDTVLAERGAGLSEGQIQRISIARALLTDAPILLLDEATSALDEATETKVLTNIKNMIGKTVLFITHRNTSLKACDSIIHVENKQFKRLF